MKENSGMFKKGKVPWNKGKSGVMPTGKSHHSWKGDRAKYSAIHMWVRKELGKPSKCEKCGTTTAKKFEWANISGEHKRDINDWKRLCASCHRKMDDSITKGWKTKKGNV